MLVTTHSHVTTTRPPHSQRTASPEQSSEAKSNSAMCIWIVNPFDQLPNETDVPLRYWALCRTFAALGHEVIWWSSDFSHLTKTKRKPCPPMDGFTVSLIATSPYTKNISLARLKNHRQFAQGFYREAMAGLQNNQLKAPDRIVVSLPPLGVAEQAFKIRDYLRNTKNAPPNSPLSTLHSSITSPCEVILDIMDAWPETFYRALPSSLRKTLGPILLAPMHRSAQRAYQGADKISAVGQNYLNLAQEYLERSRVVSCPWGALAPDSDKATGSTSQSLKQPNSWSRRIGEKPDHSAAKTLPPLHLCFHGTDLERFAQKSETPAPPLRAVYLGAMGSGYDLQTIIEVAANWKAAGIFPYQIHFAGSGPQLEILKAKSKALGLMECCHSAPLNSPPRIIFHGLLGREAVNELLLTAALALVPNRPQSLVACPYKAGEYAAAGLPMLSCLGGELGQLLQKWEAGCEYKEGDTASLQAAFKNYSTNPNRLKQQSLNARKMAGALFDRTMSYQYLCEFILSAPS